MGWLQDVGGAVSSAWHQMLPVKMPQVPPSPQYYPHDCLQVRVVFYSHGRQTRDVYIDLNWQSGASGQRQFFYFQGNGHSGKSGTRYSPEPLLLLGPRTP